MKSPIKTEYYETAAGPVKTLVEWKNARVFEILSDWKNGTTETRPGDFSVLCAFLVEHGDELIEVLEHKERGRPNGKRDSKPRVRVAPETKAA